MANSVQAYNISASDEQLEELSQRLSFTKYSAQIKSNDQDEWDFGVPAAEVKRLVTYWKDKFAWRNAERQLNELLNFKTNIEIEGFGPGAFIEVTKLLPLLKGGDGQPAFHVVALSLPNFGFSDGVDRSGFTLDKYAEVCHKLMIKLGYDQYVTQGGDWGFWVSRAIGQRYPNHCRASHINLALARQPQWTKKPVLALQHSVLPESNRDKEGHERSAWVEKEGFGYNKLQSSKPQTIGQALADSPSALLAWIYEKLHDWTDKYPWTDDEILTFVSIYWISTAGPASSVRIYYESQHPEPYSTASQSSLQEWNPHVKLGIAHFPQEIFVVPESWAATLGPVVLQSHHSSGGHFAAYEQPEAIVSDLRKMFGKGGPCYSIVSGKSGYEE